MIQIEYNHKIKQESTVISIPANIKRKILGSKAYKKITKKK